MIPEGLDYLGLNFELDWCSKTCKKLSLPVGQKKTKNAVLREREKGKTAVWAAVVKREKREKNNPHKEDPNVTVIFFASLTLCQCRNVNKSAHNIKETILTARNTTNMSGHTM